MIKEKMEPEMITHLVAHSNPGSAYLPPIPQLDTYHASFTPSASLHSFGRMYLLLVIISYKVFAEDAVVCLCEIDSSQTGTVVNGGNYVGKGCTVSESACILELRGTL